MISFWLSTLELEYWFSHLSMSIRHQQLIFWNYQFDSETDHMGIRFHQKKIRVTCPVVPLEVETIRAHTIQMHVSNTELCLSLRKIMFSKLFDTAFKERPASIGRGAQCEIMPNLWENVWWPNAVCRRSLLNHTFVRRGTLSPRHWLSRRAFRLFQ